MRLRCIGQNFTSALRLYVLEHRKNTTIFQISLTPLFVFLIILTLFSINQPFLWVISVLCTPHSYKFLCFPIFPHGCGWLLNR